MIPITGPSLRLAGGAHAETHHFGTNILKKKKKKKKKKKGENIETTSINVVLLDQFVVCQHKMPYLQWSICKH